VRPGLFRAKALDRLSSPDQLDQLVRITSPRSWLAFIALAAVIVAALVWGAVGSVPRTVSGQAILTQPGGVTNVPATAAGLVTRVEVDPGQVVSAGQVIAQLQPSGDTGTPHAGTPVAGTSIPITSPRDGRVVELLSSPGDIVDVGDLVISLEGEQDDIIAYVYVPDGPGKQIDPGMRVQLSPTSVDSSQYGYLIGTVASVSENPVTERGLTQLLSNDQLVQRFLDNGPILQVIVTIEEDPATPSGYKWSSPMGRRSSSRTGRSRPARSSSTSSGRSTSSCRACSVTRRSWMHDERSNVTPWP
jgi:multidrug efflux pump subunit AcrA (membrane-fusion protein)